MKRFACVMLVCAASVAWAQEQEPKELSPLEQAEAQIAATPDDPTPHYRKCQALFASGKQQEAVDYASTAMEKFIQAKDNLAWMGLGSIKTDKHRIDVHFNMGPKERAEKRDLIVKPYSFRVWTLDEEPSLVQILDFEIGYFGGEPMTAAIGEQKPGMHLNFGMLKTDADFAAVKTKVLAVLGTTETKEAGETE